MDNLKNTQTHDELMQTVDGWTFRTYLLPEAISKTGLGFSGVFMQASTHSSGTQLRTYVAFDHLGGVTAVSSRRPGKLPHRRMDILSSPLGEDGAYIYTPSALTIRLFAAPAAIVLADVTTEFLTKVHENPRKKAGSSDDDQLLIGKPMAPVEISRDALLTLMQRVEGWDIHGELGESQFVPAYDLQRAPVRVRFTHASGVILHWHDDYLLEAGGVIHRGQAEWALMQRLHGPQSLEPNAMRAIDRSYEMNYLLETILCEGKDFVSVRSSEIPDFFLGLPEALEDRFSSR